MAQNCSCCLVFNQADNKHDLNFQVSVLDGILQRTISVEDIPWGGPSLVITIADTEPALTLIWGRLVIWCNSPFCFWYTDQLICKAKKVNLLRNSWSPPSDDLKTEKEQWKLTCWLQGTSVVEGCIWGQETQTHSASVIQWRQLGYIFLSWEFSIIVSASWDLKISHKKREEGMHTGKTRSKIQALKNVTVVRQ